MKINKTIAIVLFSIILIMLISITNYAAEDQVLEDGIYVIEAAINENYVLDVSGPSKENETNIQLYTKWDTDAQKFKIKYLENGYYSIVSEYSGKSLDVAGGRKTNETNVQQYEENGTDAQIWKIVKNSDNTYSIISKCNDLYVDIAGGNINKNVNIQMYEGNNTAAQKFKFILKKLEEKEPVDDVKELEEPIDDNVRQILENGTYKIASSADKKYVLDVSGPSKENCANIQLFTKWNTEAQVFKINYLGNGFYSIISLYSGKSLDVSGGKNYNGVNVQQYETNNTDAQIWKIVENDDGTYSILSKCNGLYIDINGGNINKNVNIQMYEKNNSNAQKFTFVKYIDNKQMIDDGLYKISSSTNKGYVLDVSGPSKENGTNIQLFTSWDTSAQRFEVTYLGEEYYKIISLYSGKSLDVAGGKKYNGVNVQQYETNNTDAQIWKILKNNDDTYSIISKCNNLYIDIEGGNIRKNTNIQMYEGNNTKAQKFLFIDPYSVQSGFNLDNLNAAIYPGYKEALEKLNQSHPTWDFKLLYTGITLDEAVRGECALHSRNLVPSSYSGEWVCSVCGTRLYDSGWYCASEKAVAYYMDPRNFLDETNVFQFLDLNSYNSDSVSLSGIQTKVNGSFLHNYAEAINNACRNTNVNPYYIIARLIQEQGYSGTRIGTGMDGGDGRTYYNPFNIGASGNGYDAIYANALATAKANGWDSMQKAIEGGIAFCKKNWLENYQNTLYQNKFDIDSTNGTSLYTHQYMQNLMGAYSEARTLRSMYANTGKLESEFTFIIPVYERMSSTISAQPSYNSETTPINVKVTANGGLNLRSDANTNSSTIRTIPQGEVVLSVQRGINSNWQKIILNDGTIGYMSGNYLQQVNDVTNCNYSAYVRTADGSGCYIRVGPSTRLDRITALTDGTWLTVINEGTYNNIDGFNWVRVLLSDGRQAFMPSKYLSR